MKTSELPIEIRECAAAGEFDACIALQREIFNLPDIELSPRRHFIVTRHAGGWTLGAFYREKLIGFVLSVPAFRGEERIFYSHMTAVEKEFQSHGIGAKLKWAQRERARAENVRFIKWTFEPVQSRNAYFNLMRLGVVVKKYMPNFYGTDYNTPAGIGADGFDSDRLFAEWELDSERVGRLAEGSSLDLPPPDKRIVIPADWRGLLVNDPEKARAEQLRVRHEFQAAFAEGLICKGFERDEKDPAYLFFKEKMETDQLLPRDALMVPPAETRSDVSVKTVHIFRYS
jgi:predicted GNAT superfamily acetyltransferase